MTSSCSSARVMPRTPEAVRPIGRVLLSSKRMAFPLLRPRKIWLAPVVSFASSSSSPSRILMAMMPFCRGREYCSKGVFLTMPDLVAMIT